MSHLLEWLEVTPMVQKVTLLGLFMLLCGGGFHWVIAQPLIDQAEGVRREIQDLEVKLKLYARSGGQYENAKEELSQWESIVSKQGKRLGLDVPMSQVLSDMSNIAEETGLILTLWKPDQPDRVDSNQTAIRHLQLQIEGGYHNVARFLDHTQYLSKMMGVVGLTMDRGDMSNGISTVRTTIDFVGYEGKFRTTVNNWKAFVNPTQIDEKA